MKRHNEKSTKHWFSIYQLVERYLEEQKNEANTGTSFISTNKIFGFNIVDLAIDFFST